MVITRRTRNPLAFRGPWVRIPPAPPSKKLFAFFGKERFFRLLLFYQLLLISKNTKAALIKSQMLQFTREHSSSPPYSRNLPGEPA